MCVWPAHPPPQDPLVLHHLQNSALALTHALCTLRTSPSTHSTDSAVSASTALFKTLRPVLANDVLWASAAGGKNTQMSLLKKLLHTIPYIAPSTAALVTPSEHERDAAKLMRENVAGLIVAIIGVRPLQIEAVVRVLLAERLELYACDALEKMLAAEVSRGIVGQTERMKLDTHLN